MPRVTQKTKQKMSKSLYNRIVKAIPRNLFVSPDAKLRCAINIYLTATGARPACIPFDGEIQTEGGMPTDEMVEYIQKHPKILNNLRKIPEIIILEGPYYDIGTSFVVANKELLPQTQKYLNTIIKTREDMERDGIDDIPGELHIAMGTMLGYTCPMDLDDIFSSKDPVYNISIWVDDIEIDMRVSCPNTKNYLTEVVWNQLDKFQEVLNPIKKKSEIRIYKVVSHKKFSF